MLVMVLAAACTPPRRMTDDDLATRLVAWDIARRRADARMRDVPLPSIALRVPGIGVAVDDVVIVAIPRRSPHFAAVARAWPAICERRGALPDDVLEYTLAWCRRDDLERALLGFTASTVPGLRAAAIDDLVELLAETHDAATALHVIDRIGAGHAIARLAALYEAFERDDEAALVRRRLPPVPAPDAGCAELAAALATLTPGSIATIRGVAVGSTACAAAARTLACRIAAAAPELPHDPVCELPAVADREAHYLAAYAHWSSDWRAVVAHARAAMPEPGAEQVAIAALWRAARANDPPILDEVRALATTLSRDPAHDPRWTATLAEFANSKNLTSL